MFRVVQSLLLFVAVCFSARSAYAFRVFDLSSVGLGIGRWDAAPHFVDGVERSLDGGLRYSVQGGSYEAYRDLFEWQGVPPSVAVFQATVEQAFSFWEAVDPATGLGSALRFVPDFDTPAFAEPYDDGPRDRLNRGAEIDLLAEEVPGFSATTVLFGDPDANSVTLTSGVPDYPAIVGSGSDLYMSTSRSWNINSFLDNLSHEIGHAIILADVDIVPDDTESGFIDDNYDDTSSAMARHTLTNSFADLVDPFDPDNSPGLAEYVVCTSDPNNPGGCYGDPGIDSFGADLQMETSPNKIVIKPQNDEFAGRQFLYPFVRVPGDFNGDSLLSVEDVDLLSAEIKAEDPRSWFDVNGDDAVDGNDLKFWITDLKETFFGDANLDGRVDATDLNAVGLSWRADDVTSWGQGDFTIMSRRSFPRLESRAQWVS
jgi:hypothetical protein